MSKFEWKVDEPKEFIFENKKYTTVEGSSGEDCLKCEIGNKKCAFNRGTIPQCLSFNRVDGKDVYFKEIV